MHGACRDPPAHQVAVQRACEYELAVGGELDERHGRVVVVDERLEAVARAGVPDPAQAVVAARHDQRAVAVEVHGSHRVAVRRQHLEALPGLHVPQADRLVKGPGHDEVRLGVIIATEDVVRVALEDLHASTLGCASLPFHAGVAVSRSRTRRSGIGGTLLGSTRDIPHS